MEQILLTERELKRYEMVQARLKSGCKIDKVLIDYGVSRRAFYANLHKFEREGIEGLKSKWGKHRKTSNNDEKRFEKLFREYPFFSSYEFSQLLNLNPRTIQRIIIRRRLTRVYKPKKQRIIFLEKLKQEKKRT